jgi:hypothetical protein
MPRDLKLNEYGDIDLSSGDFEFVESDYGNVDEIVQLALTLILKVYDEDVYELETGVDWFGIMTNVKAPLKQKELELRATLTRIPEVTQIKRLDIIPPGADRKMMIAVELDTIYGATGVIGNG